MYDKIGSAEKRGRLATVRAVEFAGTTEAGPFPASTGKAEMGGKIAKPYSS